MDDLDHLCLHSITTKPWPLEIAVKKYSSAGIRAISVWRQALEGKNPADAGNMIQNEGLEIVSLVRGGFLASHQKSKRADALEENKKALEEAAALGAPMIVMVCGADPEQSLESSRIQIKEGLHSLLPVAEEYGIKLAIEPLHPMYADTRSAIINLKQATDLALELESDFVGVVVDVYHVWWDMELEQQVQRCGEMTKLFAYHICDWRVPTRDMLNDREIMGYGCIPIPEIRKWVEAAGFKGFQEVEIFSDHYWQQDQDDYLDKIINAYINYS